MGHDQSRFAITALFQRDLRAIAQPGPLVERPQVATMCAAANGHVLAVEPGQGDRQIIAVAIETRSQRRPKRPRANRRRHQSHRTHMHPGAAGRGEAVFAIDRGVNVDFVPRLTKAAHQVKQVSLGAAAAFGGACDDGDVHGRGPANGDLLIYWNWFKTAGRGGQTPFAPRTAQMASVPAGFGQATASKARSNWSKLNCN